MIACGYLRLMYFSEEALYWVSHIVYTVNNPRWCNLKGGDKGKQRETRGRQLKAELLWKPGFKAAADQQLNHIHWNIQQPFPTHFPQVSVFNFAALTVT